ncbi:MAG TPA: M28 family peptidase [Tepidisphaeraceae bacterium]|nr:M28 family peptidase [Tepidisphaeraceae bacterium]
MADLAANLRRHIDVLAELIGERNTSRPSALELARRYLRSELTAMELVVAETPFETHVRSALNLEVVLPGSKPAKSTLVIGAHYDSAAGTPGADDNASAVATLLEIARDLSGRKLKRKTRLVFYDCEEPPHFNLGEMGSQFHAIQMRRNGEKLLGMICLESLGYFGECQKFIKPPWPLRLLDSIIGPRYLIVVSNVASIPFGVRFVTKLFTSGKLPIFPAALPVKWVPDIALSDHRGYWEQGFRALMITNTAHLRNPNYHTANDRLETLNIDRLTKACRQIQTAVRRLL